MTEQDFDRRLGQALKESQLDLENGKVVEQKPDNSDAEAASGLAFGMRIGVEFASGTVVGFLMGFGIDKYFNTTPWFLLIFTLLGFCAGMLNVYRAVNNLDEGIGINKQLNKRKAGQKPD